MLTLNNAELLKLSPVDNIPIQDIRFPTILWVNGFQQFVNMFPLNGIIDRTYDINNHPEKDEICWIIGQLIYNKKDGDKWNTWYFPYVDGKKSNISSEYDNLYKHNNLSGLTESQLGELEKSVLGTNGGTSSTPDVGNSLAYQPLMF